MKTTWMLIKIWYHIFFFVFGESQDSEMLLIKFLYFSPLTIIVMIIDKDHKKNVTSSWICAIAIYYYVWISIF